ncbi:hypothetical protein PVAND_012569 [Polypedilum vanderplanki]|uniref:Uncharacterized protein n=1 Tax=Polypedilum vanderplanki TaxID=319348 RepID=A0A9J6CN41_POLVA|nr:hypothetical protein PVAND_012569 [Polypedilum vanderplanki]
MWNKQQVAVVVISFIVTNCFIQISCNITSNHTSSADLIDNIAVNDINNNNNSHNNDKSETHNEDLVASRLSLTVEEIQTTDSFECHCDSTDQDCFRQCLNDDDLNSLSNMFLLTAGEVLLGCAIIMGLSALVTMMLRVCTRSRLARNRREISDLDEVLQRCDNRASLTSLQQDVVAKLRDRPPRYETRHNYEYRRRETDDDSEGTAASFRNVAVLNPGASRLSEPPPPYIENGDSSTVHELPPAYTISLSTDDCYRNDANQIECVGGISNQSFTCNDCQQCQDNNNNSCCCCNSISGTRAISNRNCDNILYI